MLAIKRVKYLEALGVLTNGGAQRSKPITNYLK